MLGINHLAADTQIVTGQSPGHLLKFAAVKQVEEHLHPLGEKTVLGDKQVETLPSQGEKIEIAIRNEGLIIPEQELANIFQKFYRLDAARSSRTGGAGLGLAIAREIISLHGGSIRAESNGKRTSFLIVLPAEAGAQGDQPSA